MDSEEDLVNINLSLRLSAARGCLFRSNLDNEESNQMSKLNYYNSNPYYISSLQPVRLDRIFSLPDI